MFGVSGLCFEALLARRLGRPATSAWYGVWSFVWMCAHVAGAAATGGLLGFAGGRLPWRDSGGYVFLLAMAAATLHSFGLVTVPLPKINRQVPRNWMSRWPLLATAVGYGLQLGAGITTRVTHVSTWVALLGALLTADAANGALLFSVYGLMRSLPPVIGGPASASPEGSFGLALRFARYDATASRLAQWLLAGWTLALAAAIVQERI